MFGPSPYLQSSDYQAPGNVTGDAASVWFDDFNVHLGLQPPAVSMLTRLIWGGARRVQLRVTLSPDSFTNFNGA